MKIRLITLSLIAVFMFSGMNTPAVKAQYAHRGSTFENWAVGVDLLSMYGFGVYGATSLLPNLKMRVGFDYLPFNYNDGIDFDAPIVNLPSGFGSDLEMGGELSKLKLKFPNAKLLVDYYPVKDGIFCITGGFYIGNNRITADGMIDDYQSYVDMLEQYGIEPEFEFEDVVIKPNDDGSFSAKLKMGNTVKPYLGFGLGRTISKSRVGFRFDMGIVYQGKYSIESENVSEGIDRVNDLAADFDLPFSKKLLEWWPMMSFSLSYRIK